MVNKSLMPLPARFCAGNPHVSAGCGETGLPRSRMAAIAAALRAQTLADLPEAPSGGSKPEKPGGSCYRIGSRRGGGGRGAAAGLAGSGAQ